MRERGSRRCRRWPESALVRCPRTGAPKFSRLVRLTDFTLFLEFTINEVADFGPPRRAAGFSGVRTGASVCFTCRHRVQAAEAGAVPPRNTLAAMRSRENVAAVFPGIEAMGCEEAARRSAAAMRRKRPRRVPTAPRILSSVSGAAGRRS